MASNVSVSTVARVVVPHKVPTTDLAALTYLLHPCMWPRLASQHFSLGKETGQTPCRDLCCTVSISDKILSGCGFRDVSVLHGILRFS